MTGSTAEAERKEAVRSARSPVTLRPKRVTPASPLSSARKIHPGAAVPGNGGIKIASASAPSAGSTRQSSGGADSTVVMSSFHGARDEPAGQAPLDDEEERQHRDGEQGRGGHDGAPVSAAGAVPLEELHEQRKGEPGGVDAEERQREHELVVGEDEREHA